MKWTRIAFAALLAACTPKTFADLADVQTFVSGTVLPAVGAGGLDPLMSDYARQNADPEAQERWLRMFQQLGPIVDAGQVSCNVTTALNTGPDMSGTFANCASEATYANGKAQVTVRLRKEEEAWKVDAVNVNSDLFARLMEKGLAPDPAPDPGPDPGAGTAAADAAPATAPAPQP